MTPTDPAIYPTHDHAPHPPKRKQAPTEIQGKPDRIRAELNIEKWPAIWNPTHSKTHSKTNAQSRTLERESTQPDGTKAVSTVTINPIAHRGDLTTDDQRTLYALIKHWEQRDKPDRETPFSIRHLAKLLHKGWGTNVIDSLTGSLERLRGTMLIWSRSYRSKDQRVEDLETVYVNILAKLKIVRRKVDGHITIEGGYFQFDDHILKNLLTNYTKPFLFEVFMEIKGEIALKLYSYLDLIMADKTRFERCTKDLFEDLGLNGASYQYPSKRKRNLEKAFKELTGIMFTTGVLKSATIEKTKDGRDYKAVFQKISRAQFAEESDPATTFTTAEPVVINDYSKRKDALEIQGEELVRRFYKLFHAIDNPSINSKQIAQAVVLIAQHGEGAAQFIVEFSAKTAAETGYRPQTFGGILHYTPRALAAFEATQRLLQNKQPTAATPKPGPEPGSEQGPRSSRLDALPEEQYNALYERAVERLRDENAFIDRHFVPESPVVAQLVKAMMLRELGSVSPLAASAALELSPEAEQITPQTPAPSQEYESAEADQRLGRPDGSDDPETGNEKIAA